MKKACLVVNDYYTNNRIFDLDDKISNRDNCLYFFHTLKEEFSKRDINLSTQDINNPNDSEIVIYNEMPFELPRKENIYKSYLFLFESELIKPDNWNLENHKYFTKIFTWDDNKVDNLKYYKFNFSHKIPKDFCFKTPIKLCTLIAGNKTSKHPLELYSKRVEAIRWFEKNHATDFDFYGIGWDKKTFKGAFQKLNKFNILRQLLFKKYPSYKGMVESKFSTLSKYKFAICYENATDIPGYITEKIFDCFFTGCIPIYWGAPNIDSFIPKDCFIDRNSFLTYKDLYIFIKSMPDTQYLTYRNNIKTYLQSDSVRQFSAELNSINIVEAIING